MMFDWQAINQGSGFCLDSLTRDELAEVRSLITGLYLARLAELAPALVAQAEAAGIDRYHTLQIPFDHAASWPKAARSLPKETLSRFEQMNFFGRVRQVLPSAEIVPYDTMWRLVRPGQPTDIGPVHADKWFWDAGNGAMRPGYERLKIWIGLYTEPGANGLSVKSYSHTSTWKHHFEFKHGVMKPVLDEREEDLHMEPLSLAAGDLVLFNDALLHGGMLNRGTRCRVSLEMTVVYAADEGRKALEPRQAA